MYSVLESDSSFKRGKNDLPENMLPSGPAAIEAQQEACKRLTGSDMLPPVLYKGRWIEAGRLGSRELPKGD